MSASQGGSIPAHARHRQQTKRAHTARAPPSHLKTYNEAHPAKRARKARATSFSVGKLRTDHPAKRARNARATSSPCRDTSHAHPAKGRAGRAPPLTLPLSSTERGEVCCCRCLCVTASGASRAVAVALLYPSSLPTDPSGR